MNALLRHGSAWNRQRIRVRQVVKVEVTLDSVRGEVDGLRCWGAGDRVVIGWDVYLRSVGDERRRQIGRGALRCLVPRLVWADVREG